MSPIRNYDSTRNSDLGLLCHLSVLLKATGPHDLHSVLWLRSEILLLWRYILYHKQCCNDCHGAFGLGVFVPIDTQGESLLKAVGFKGTDVP